MTRAVQTIELKTEAVTMLRIVPLDAEKFDTSAVLVRYELPWLGAQTTYEVPAVGPLTCSAGCTENRYPTPAEVRAELLGLRQSAGPWSAAVQFELRPRKAPLHFFPLLVTEAGDPVCPGCAAKGIGSTYRLSNPEVVTDSHSPAFILFDLDPQAVHADLLRQAAAAEMRLRRAELRERLFLACGMTPGDTVLRDAPAVLKTAQEVCALLGLDYAEAFKDGHRPITWPAPIRVQGQDFYDLLVFLRWLAR